MTRNHQERFILQRTAEGMHSAVRHIGNVVDWLSGDGEKTFGGVSVKGEVEELGKDYERCGEALMRFDDVCIRRWDELPGLGVDARLSRAWVLLVDLITVATGRC